jgi:hypothetical protein
VPSAEHTSARTSGASSVSAASSASIARRRWASSVTLPSACAAVTRDFGLPVARSRRAASNVIVDDGN